MNPEDDAAVRRLVDMQMEAWCRGDAEGYASTAGDDFGFTNIRGQRWTGRASFVAAHERIFTGIFAGSQLEAHIERIAFPAADVAVVEMLLHLTSTKGMPPGIVPHADGVLRTRLLEVFARRNDTWTLTTCHNTALAADVSA